MEHILMYLRIHFLHDFLQRFRTTWMRYHLEICRLQATDIALLNVFPHLFLASFLQEYSFLHFHLRPFGYESFTHAITMAKHYLTKKVNVFDTKFNLKYAYIKYIYTCTNRRNWGCIWQSVLASHHFHPRISLRQTMERDCYISVFLFSCRICCSQ